MTYFTNEYDLDEEEMYGSLQEYFDRETGERYTVNPITGARNYIEDEPELLSTCCGSVPNGELSQDDDGVYTGRCDGCQEMSGFTEGE